MCEDNDNKYGGLYHYKAQMTPTQGVKSRQGLRHATDGSWDGSGKSLRTLCREVVSPDSRDIPLREDTISCPYCLAFLKDGRP